MVPKAMQEERLSRFKNVCRDQGLRLTPQKLAIFEELVKTDDHPSAQMIFDRLTKQFPDLSFATVYKNLHLLSKLGLAIEIETADGTARFDANTETHHHIINTKTGKITDAHVNGHVPLPNNLSPNKIKRISVTYYI